MSIIKKAVLSYIDTQNHRKLEERKILYKVRQYHHLLKNEFVVCFKSDLWHPFLKKKKTKKEAHRKSTQDHKPRRLNRNRPTVQRNQESPRVFKRLETRNFSV